MLTPTKVDVESEEYDGFEHLRRALFWEPDTLMFVHTAYFDDSGKKDTELVLVGGYVATVREWDTFSTDWRLSLARKNIEEFKRADFNAKEIGDWPTSERVRFLIELGNIIHKYTKHAFAYAVSMPDWRRANEKYQMEEKNFYPYPICARTCIRGVREWCDLNKYDRSQIEYMFDGGSEDSGHLLLMLKRDFDPLLRALNPVPADSKKVRPIQAADYFAWEVRHQALKDTNPYPADAFPNLRQILRIPARANVGIYDYARLEDMCIAAKVPLR